MLFLVNLLIWNKRLEVKGYYIFGGKLKWNLRLLLYGVNVFLILRIKIGIISWFKEIGFEIIDCL